jgi:signal transduction histidine kinase
LGLSVVHGIVESFGASIKVETEIGAGTTSRVFFPAVVEVNTAGDVTAADA